MPYRTTWRLHLETVKSQKLCSIKRVDCPHLLWEIVTGLFALILPGNRNLLLRDRWELHLIHLIVSGAYLGRDSFPWEQRGEDNLQFSHLRTSRYPLCQGNA